MKRFDKIAVLVLLLLNVVLKIIFLDFNSLGGDEPFSVYHAQMDISSIIHHLLTGNNPPLFEILLHFWIKIFGISEFAVRFPSLVFSSLTVFVVYRIGKDFFSTNIALITSLLFTFSNYQLSFAHEARVYALFAFLTAMSMFWFLKICNQNRPKYFVWLLVTNVILIYAHYFGLFVIFIQTASFLVIQDNRRLIFKRYLLYLAAVLILYMPILYFVTFRFTESVTNGTWISPPEGIGDLYIMLWKFSNMPLTTVIALVIIVAVLIKLFVQKEFKNISVNRKIIFIWFWAPFLFMFIISFKIPIFLDRYLIFLSIGYYLFLGICADYLFTDPKYKFIAPAVLVMSFIITFNPNVDNKRHVKETVAKIRNLKEDKTAVLVYPSHFVLNFSYYYNPSIFKDYDNEFVYNKMFANLRKENIFALNNTNQINLDGYSHIIYLDAAGKFSMPDKSLITSLEKGYHLNSTSRFYEIFIVYEFVKNEKRQH
jgi:4-amino-4-deoxy-L-arabinose transferase-like glycosyltransferase